MPEFHYHYCETAQLGSVQPLNMATGLPVIIYALWLLIGKRQDSPPIMRLVHHRHYAAGFLWLGAGTLLWHATADSRFLLWDVSGVIIVFVLLLLHAAAVVKILSSGRIRLWMSLTGGALITVGSFAAGNIFLAWPVDAGGFATLALVLIAAGVGCAVGWDDAAFGRNITAAGVLLLFASWLRAADLPWCEFLPWGTHGGWHLLGSAAMIVLMIALNRLSDEIR